MSHPDATLYIHKPIFDMTVAVQITANARWRNGVHAWADASGGDLAVESFTIYMLVPVGPANT
jgi:hypothetical protein